MPGKLLVVDNERDVCDFLKTFFGERDFQVFAAATGDEALLIARREKPDVVLLEIKMPGMDGIAILKHLKEIDKGTKVIMVTVLDSQDSMYEAYKLGACDYITKPLVLENLEQSVQRHLGQ